MRRLLATSLVIASVAACGGPGSASPRVPATATSDAPGAGSSLALASPSLSPSVVPVAFPTSGFAALSDKPMPEPVAERLQAALDSPIYGGGVAATVISQAGTWSGASGTSDGIHAIELESQFGIGSVTKSIVAAQVMQLVEAGEVSLDTRAAEYLPADFTFNVNGATIRQLLAHRSGIPDWYPAMKERFAKDRLRVWTIDEILAQVPMGRSPVGTFQYTDTNYNLLGLVIEHVRQRPLVAVLRSGVLRVEGTERLIWQPDEAPTAPMAMPRGEAPDAIELGGGYLPSLSDTIDGAAGGMASDSISLARWWRAFCAGEIVSEASLTVMSTLSSDEDAYGLGLLNPGGTYAPGVGHLGGNFGYNAWAGCLTEDHLIVVVLVNQDETDIFHLGEPMIAAARSG